MTRDDTSHTSPPIYIGVMGMTGSGKSTFIKTLTKNETIAIGTKLRSCTRVCQAASMHYGLQEVILIDTPGFDDSDREDFEILEELIAWLELLDRNENIQLSGLIYIHRITDNRIGGTAARNLEMMEELVGAENMRNVVLVTNRWEELHSQQKGEETESELIGPDGFWHDMVKQGARHARYDGTEETGHSIIKNIMYQSPVYLRIQQERMEGRSVQETGAGQALIRKLDAKIGELEKKMQRLLDNQEKSQNSARRREEELSEKLLTNQLFRQELLQERDRMSARVKELEDRWRCLIQ